MRKADCLGFSLRSLACISVLLAICQAATGQNIGIGVASPTRAKFEVQGSAGAGNTSAFFGDGSGISIQRNYAAIGLNQYRDDSTANSKGRYMATGYAAVWTLVHNDPTLVEGLAFDIYPYGAANSQLGTGFRAWTFSANNRWRIGVAAPAANTGLLDVGHGTGTDGTAAFLGTVYHTYFNKGPNEDTYITGGKSASHVFINDVPNGKVIFGSGGTRIGVNTQNYVPTYNTFEVRENVGGLQLLNTSYSDKPWEFIIPGTSTPNYQLFYAGTLKNYFKYTNGALNIASDRRLKTNLEPIGTILDRIMKLETVSYRFKDNPTAKQPSVGFIAQQVEPLFPLLVSHDMPGKPRLLGLNYSGFGVLAIRGVQEEQAEIDEIDKLVSQAEKALQSIQSKPTTAVVASSK